MAQGVSGTGNSLQTEGRGGFVYKKNDDQGVCKGRRRREGNVDKEGKFKKKKKETREKKKAEEKAILEAGKTDEQLLITANSTINQATTSRSDGKAKSVAGAGLAKRAGSGRRY